MATHTDMILSSYNVSKSSFTGICFIQKCYLCVVQLIRMLSLSKPASVGVVSLSSEKQIIKYYGVRYYTCHTGKIRNLD